MEEKNNQPSNRVLAGSARLPSLDVAFPWIFRRTNTDSWPSEKFRSTDVPPRRKRRPRRPPPLRYYVPHVLREPFCNGPQRAGMRKIPRKSAPRSCHFLLVSSGSSSAAINTKTYCLRGCGHAWNRWYMRGDVMSWNMSLTFSGNIFQR